MVNLARILDDRLSCSGSKLSDLAREILSARRESSTLETYQREWSRFVAWANAQRVLTYCEYPVPPEVLAAYLTWLHSEGYGRSTVRKTITVMSLAHDERDNPCGDRIVRELLKGILRRDKRPTKKARPLSLAELGSICDKLTDRSAVLLTDFHKRLRDSSWKCLRDRALLSVGWMAALRASELVALNWSDVVDVENGIELHVRQSKTNKTGDDEIIALPLLSNRYHLICPVRNLRAIQPVSVTQATDDWPVFVSSMKNELLDYVFSTRLSQRSVSRIIERSAELARLEGRFSSHCLRRGFATFAASKGLSEFQIMRHGRWKSSASASGYVERSKLWTDNPLTLLLGD